jgi:hypothetical protein
MNLSKLNRITHRDIGYLIAGMTLIYAVSGIALNHKSNWNPNYIFDTRTFRSEIPVTHENFNDKVAVQILKNVNLDSEFKTSYFPSGSKATIFINGGVVQINSETGEAMIQRISRRPFFYQLNFLHYNPGRWWKYFSDIFCISLITVTITGLFLVKGKNGITRRGAILTLAGVILPLLFLFIYR